jgi:hypothetical protein
MRFRPFGLRRPWLRRVSQRKRQVTAAGGGFIGELQPSACSAPSGKQATSCQPRCRRRWSARWSCPFQRLGSAFKRMTSVRYLICGMAGLPVCEMVDAPRFLGGDGLHKVRFSLAAVRAALPRALYACGWDGGTGPAHTPGPAPERREWRYARSALPARTDQEGLAAPPREGMRGPEPSFQWRALRGSARAHVQGWFHTPQSAPRAPLARLVLITHEDPSEASHEPQGEQEAD